MIRRRTAGRAVICGLLIGALPLSALAAPPKGKPQRKAPASAAPAPSAPAAPAFPWNPAAVAGPSTPSSNAPAPNWQGELPPAAAVLKAVKGSNPEETKRRREAALATFRDVIEAFTGRNMVTAQQMPPVARGRWAEYMSAEQVLDGQPASNTVRLLSPGAHPFFYNHAFRLQVLTRFLSPATLAAYRNTQSFRALNPPAEAEMAPPANQAANQAQLAPLAGGVDGAVFGIALLRPLTLPACQDSAQGDGLMGMLQAAATMTAQPNGPLFPTTATCRVVAQGLMAQMKSNFSEVSPRGNQGAKPSNYKEVLVSLPKERCPDWLSSACVLTVSTLNGTVVAVSMMTRGSAAQARIEKELTQKYKRAPATRKPDECERSGSYSHSEYGGTSVTAPIKRAGTRMTWKLPMLTVQYITTDGYQCGEGIVYVVTDAYFDALEAVDNSQPKM